MRKYILIILGVICGWLAPSALADRLVFQEPRYLNRRIITEREFRPAYYTDDEIRTFRTHRVHVRDWDDDDDDARNWDDDDDNARVVVRRAYPVERRVIIRRYRD